MHRIIKTTPLLLGVTALSACSALNLGTAKTSANANAQQDGTYTQVASNMHGGTMSDYTVDSGWYATEHTSNGQSPYAGGEVQMDMSPTDIYPAGMPEVGISEAYELDAHNGYHDAYGNPAPAPQYGTPAAPHETVVYADPGLRGSYGPSYYGNIGGIMYDTDADLYGIIARAGLQKNWYGAELEGSFGIADEDETIVMASPNGTGPIPVEVSAGIDHTLAAFATGRVPLGSRINALGRVGYHTTKISAEGSNGGISANASESFDGVAYGAGLEYDFDQVNGVRVDYTRYDLGDDATSDSLAATYLRRF